MHLDRIMSEIEREKGGRGTGVRETERDRSETERQKHGERERFWVGFSFLYVINIIGKYNWSSCFQDFY